MWLSFSFSRITWELCNFIYVEERVDKFIIEKYIEKIKGTSISIVYADPDLHSYNTYCYNRIQ